MADPLTRAAFHILLALAPGRGHGLGIADDIEQLTSGQLQLGPGTLYRSLKEMALAGLIREATPADGDDPRRRHYVITAIGRAAVESEARRYADLSQVARRRGVLHARARS